MDCDFAFGVGFQLLLNHGPRDRSAEDGNKEMALKTRVRYHPVSSTLDSHVQSVRTDQRAKARQRMAW